MAENIKESLEKVYYEISIDLVQLLEKTIPFLEKVDIKRLEELKKGSDSVRKKMEDLTENLFTIIRRADKDKKYLNVLPNILNAFQRILYLIDGIINRYEIKEKEGILFSDKAITELKSLFSQSHKIMKDSADLILTKNRVLADHIINEKKIFFNLAEEFASEHAQRLITGICMPKASSLYINLVDTLKGIFAQEVKIAKEIYDFTK
ncbi:MAG: hypothetical protein JRI44_04900 [Deltaproteobacteria bacterium]|nr:hypothetical protein [Deltaproteobacteria bacterium]